MVFVKCLEAKARHFFAIYDILTALATHQDAYISRSGDFCANNDDNDNDKTNYFTPCACAARRVNMLQITLHIIMHTQLYNMHI